MKRTLSPGWAVGTFLTALAVGGCLAGEHPTDEQKRVPPATVVRCEEDEPCWDCATMGNLICGPMASATGSGVILIPPMTIQQGG